MLILSRQEGETIVIGEPGPDQIVIEIVEFRGRRVRVGIMAPTDIPISRGELLTEDGSQYGHYPVKPGEKNQKGVKDKT